MRLQMSWEAGSSPLARGLPARTLGALRSVRIIPARAGFTRADPRGPALRPDHPRSRGVYKFEEIRADSRPGSSPLARGLHGDALGLRRRRRIIPARAGFTRSWGRPASYCRDHPRSRGVYFPLIWTTAALTGSSPLARGLPRSSGATPRPTRIIPARAGFTINVAHVTSRYTDHPRSRGVYGTRPATTTARSWIIPARAGFTASCTASRPASWDHPRSRGVYTQFGIGKSRYQGSSPLARGLQSCVDSALFSGGIIPARAGFTT